MPKRTKKQKIKAAQQKNVHSRKEVKSKDVGKKSTIDPYVEKQDTDTKKQASLSPAEMKKREEDEQFTPFFVQDIKKTGIAIGVLLAIEGVVYYINTYLSF